MYPINQVFLGNDPMMSNIEDLDFQIQKMEAYRQKLKQLKVNQTPAKLIWDDIDAEISPMTEEQRLRLFYDEEYTTNYNDLQSMVQSEILNLVKGKIESTEKGRELLNSQLKLVKKLKSKIIEETNREMELFKNFKEYSKTHPDVTYEEFLKSKE